MAENVAISRNGRFGVEIASVWEPDLMGMRHAYAVPIEIRLEPRLESTWIRLVFGQMWLDDYQRGVSWNDWTLPLQQAVKEFAHIAIGEHLDKNGIPPMPGGEEAAVEIEFSKNLAELGRRRPAEDEDIRLYLAGLLHWAEIPEER